MAWEINHWNIGGIKCKTSPNYKDKIDTIISSLENTDTNYITNIQETHISSPSEIPK